MGKHTDAWRAHERRTAKALGLERTGNRGTATADAAGRWLVAECKSRAKLPLWLLRAVGQAEGAAGPAQLPVAVLHQVGERAERDLVVMTRSQFADWFGALMGMPEEEETA